MRTVVLLRHGRTAWNAQRRYQGQADPPLDDVGRAQAIEAAAFLAALRPDYLISSHAARALETAAPLGELTGLPVIREPRLSERALGHWEGLTRDEVAARFPEEYADWQAGRDVRRRGGETRQQVADRALAAFTDLPDVATAILVTHSATALALCSALLGMGQEVHLLGPLANCHWSQLNGAQPNGAQPNGAQHRDGAPLWRLRAHNLGAPGSVLPLPVRVDVYGDDAPDADA